MSDVAVHKVTKPDDRTLPIFKETEELLRRIRERAFDLFSGRGFDDGHALEDWLAAEREICWPAGELAERGTDYVLTLALPGFEPGEVSVTATARELIVHAKSEHQEESKRKERLAVRWSEFRGDDVYRRVELADSIDVPKVSASLKNGLLTIVAPKLAVPQRTVPVAAAA
jgi:HSP20 family molecular chaperone IbpA